MRLPRFRFTLRQLIGFIVLIGIGLGLLRTPFGPLVVFAGIPIFGFAAERARVGKDS